MLVIKITSRQSGSVHVSVCLSVSTLGSRELKKVEVVDRECGFYCSKNNTNSHKPLLSHNFIIFFFVFFFVLSIFIGAQKYFGKTFTASYLI